MLAILNIRRARKIRLHSWKGIVAARQDIEIIVGNRLFLEEHRIALPSSALSQTDSEILVAREGRFLGTLIVADMLRP
jgi:cation transport ATPase